MNLMEARKEKLKSELLSLAYDSHDPNSIILPMAENWTQEDILWILQNLKEENEYKLNRLRNEHEEYYEAYRYGKITE